MATVGIAGCTALLLTGLGLQNAINDIIDKQYGEIYHFNTIVRMDSEASQDAKDNLAAVVGGETDAFTWVSTGNDIAVAPDTGTEHRVEFVVAQDAAALQQFVTMRTRVGQTPLQLDGEGAIISEKLASQLGVSVGDTVQLYDEDDIGNLVGQPHDVRVAGIMENYVSQYVYVTAQVYQDMMGQEPSFSTVYASLPDGADRDAFSDDTLALDDVKTVTYNDETIDSYRTMLKTVDSVVVVLVVAAALLAFVVLYNLTNINITERAREIATLKVLGFTPREVDAYIFRETMLLSVIGAVVGMLLGVVMEGFVITTAEVDQVMFGRDIHAVSFVIAFALTHAVLAYRGGGHAQEAAPHQHGGKPEVKRVGRGARNALHPERGRIRLARALQCACASQAARRAAGREPPSPRQAPAWGGPRASGCVRPARLHAVRKARVALRALALQYRSVRFYNQKGIPNEGYRKEAC